MPYTIEVVKRTGCKYSGITLSKEQLKFAEERVKDAGLQVTFVGSFMVRNLSLLTLKGARPGGFPSSQVILPLAPTIEHEEFLKVVRIEGHAFSLEDVALACDMYLLQLCSGIDESSIGACAQLVFAPIDGSFADDALLVD
ncbi:hypothetical protein P8452_43568 [Trifolium repens]|nr:hypothetical protein P8452_43568 [Trifolium repens]